MQFLGDDGLPLVGGCLYTYDAGTSTPRATYTDATGGTPNANPIVLDSAGRASIWLQGYYYMELWTEDKDAEGSQAVLVWSQDNVSGEDVVRSDLSSVATGKGAALVGATGQNGKTVGQLFDGSYGVPIYPASMTSTGYATVLDTINGNDVRYYMDGQAGRPTLAAWVASPTTVDVAASIQAAEDAIEAAGTGVLVFPSGTFKAVIGATGLTMKKGVRWVGQSPSEGGAIGPVGSKIVFSFTGAGTTGLLIKAASGTIYRPALENLAFVNEGSAAAGKTLVKIDTASEFSIDNCQFNGYDETTDVSLNIHASAIGALRRTIVNNSPIGALLSGSNTSISFKDHCNFWNNTTAALKINGSATSCRIIDSWMENFQKAIYIIPDGGVDMSVNALVVRDNHITTADAGAFPDARILHVSSGSSLSRYIHVSRIALRDNVGNVPAGASAAIEFDFSENLNASNHIGSVTVDGGNYTGNALVTSDTSLLNLRVMNDPWVETEWFSGVASPYLAGTGKVLTDNLADEYAIYTPVWTGSITNPVLGDGSIYGWYTKRGHTVTASITLVAGSTTTFGSGSFQFSLPFDVHNDGTMVYLGAARIGDSNTGKSYLAVVRAYQNLGIVTLQTNGEVSAITATSPITWASGDVLEMTVTYQTDAVDVSVP